MDLWIRSQDKTRLSLTNDLRIEYCKEKDMWAIDDCDYIAFYKTKERALEVLDEIHSILIPKMVYKNITIDNSKKEEINQYFNKNVYFNTNNNADIHFINNTYVYQMPED